MNKINKDEVKERLRYLKNKRNLTHKEMEEFKKLSPPGTFKCIGNWGKIGVQGDRFFKSASNLKFVGEKISESINSGFYIEAISLRLMLLDFCLRLYLANKGEDFDEKHPHDLQFGVLFKECRNSGFDKDLLKRIEYFNEKRILAIHNFIYEGIPYEDFKDFLIETDNLLTDVLNYHSKNI